MALFVSNVIRNLLCINDQEIAMTIASVTLTSITQKLMLCCIILKFKLISDDTLTMCEACEGILPFLVERDSSFGHFSPEYVKYFLNPFYYNHNLLSFTPCMLDFCVNGAKKLTLQITTIYSISFFID